MQTILHIGADKTGTTAIQSALAARRSELAERGVWYPDLDGRPDHRSLAEADLGATSPPTAPPGIDRVVFSSEAFWSLPAPRIEQLLDWLPLGSATVVAYVRHPVAHAEAAFGQRCRMARSERELRAILAVRSLPPPINPIITRALRRLRQLEAWSAALGPRTASAAVPDDLTARLVVRSYQPGPAWDVVADFCSAAGLDAMASLLVDRPNPRPNPTPGLAVIHASVLVRQRSGPADQARFLDAVAEHRGGGDGDPELLLSPSLRRHLHRRAMPVLAGLHHRVGGLGLLLDRGDESDGDGAADPPRRPSLDQERAERLLAETWPDFPAGSPSP